MPWPRKGWRLPHIIQLPLRHAALTHTYIHTYIHTVRFVTPCNDHIMIESRKLSSNYRAYIHTYIYRTTNIKYIAGAEEKSKHRRKKKKKTSALAIPPPIHYIKWNQQTSKQSYIVALISLLPTISEYRWCPDPIQKEEVWIGYIYTYRTVHNTYIHTYIAHMYTSWFTPLCSR